MTRGIYQNRQVLPGVAGEQRGGQRRFQQDLGSVPFHVGGYRGAYLLHGGGHAAAAVLFLMFRYLMGKVVGRGAFAAGIGENVYL